MAADLSSRIAGFVADVTRKMGVTLDVEVEDDQETLRLNLTGEDGEVFVRRQGEGLEALQHVTNTIFRRQLEDRRLVIDCLDFRRGKDAELKQMTRFLMERAKTTGTPQEIGPLNSYARRIVHLTVSEDPLVSSESIGDAAMKTVIISTRG
jgi:spoIIIJ-associated protein